MVQGLSPVVLRIQHRVSDVVQGNRSIHEILKLCKWYTRWTQFDF